MFLIAGLGNPGEKYQKTRHSIGFSVIENLKLKIENFSDWKHEKKFQAEISQGKIDKQKVILAKPQTFMNNSGKAVTKLTKNYKLKTINLFVIHDDADLPLGTIRIVKNRGSAGHKGVESIMRALKTQNFVRFRIGTWTEQNRKIPSRPHTKRAHVSHFGAKGASARYGVGARPSKFMAHFLVEQKITPTQEEILKKVIKKCVEAIEMTVREGLEKAMSEYN